jgi:hypothetical protein
VNAALKAAGIDEVMVYCVNDGGKFWRLLGSLEKIVGEKYCG